MHQVKLLQGQPHPQGITAVKPLDDGRERLKGASDVVVQPCLFSSRSADWLMANVTWLRNRTAAILDELARILARKVDQENRRRGEAANCLVVAMLVRGATKCIF